MATIGCKQQALLPHSLEDYVGEENPVRVIEVYNLTPADVYFGHGQAILVERERIKRQTIANRRLQHQSQAA